MQAGPASAGKSLLPNVLAVAEGELLPEGYSIPAQTKSLHGYATEEGIKLLREFIDVETAKQPGRPGFMAMVDFFAKEAKKDPQRRVRTLLVEKTDRLYRNLKDYVTIDDLKIDIHFVKENVILSPDSHSSEKFMHGIKVLMAKNYVDNLGEEVRKGMREKAEQGIPPNRAPLGYLNVEGPDGHRTIGIDEAVAAIVRRMFEAYATGQFSLAAIADLAKAEGLFAGARPTGSWRRSTRSSRTRTTTASSGTGGSSTRACTRRSSPRNYGIGCSGFCVSGAFGSRGRSSTTSCSTDNEAIDRLQKEYKRFQERIDRMYIDKLDGRINAAFFDQKSAEWRAEQTEILHSIQEHQTANQSYLEEGVALLELASRAADLFAKQPAE